jgi:hypothetical protein
MYHQIYIQVLENWSIEKEIYFYFGAIRYENDQYDKLVSTIKGKKKTMHNDKIDIVIKLFKIRIIN